MLKIKPFREKTGCCGPACLKMVLAYFGIKKTEKELAQLTGCTPEKGTTAEALIKGAQKLGFKGFYKDNASLDGVEEYVIQRKIPVIVDWFCQDDGHYSVVVDIGKENIQLIDPELGYIRALRLKDFYRLWFDFPGDFIKSKEDLILRRLIVIYK